MDDLIIFVFGCVVFVVTLGSGFVYLIASDNPDKLD